MTEALTTAPEGRPFDLPLVFKRHVFICAQQRPPMHPRGSCAASGAMPLIERLSAKIQALQDPELAVTVTGCLGFCQAGPVVVVYPEGIWYAPKTVEDIDEICVSHLCEGEPVERLIFVPKV
ncbi:(2Fe-2S) ferredoxin domain-containing protein [Rhodomicrobium sp.]|jgi:(2Fe-2S) ferredoxin|uniref:(2Fe-2S) ferredoxin domain-containing protein n=1 Tax=Rhodomicrobium sp. TaxID=2720632 RepID=UPI0039E6C19D